MKKLVKNKEHVLSSKRTNLHVLQTLEWQPRGKHYNQASNFSQAAQRWAIPRLSMWYLRASKIWEQYQLFMNTWLVVLVIAIGHARGYYRNTTENNLFLAPISPVLLYNGGYSPLTTEEIVQSTTGKSAIARLTCRLIWSYVSILRITGTFTWSYPCPLTRHKLQLWLLSISISISRIRRINRFKTKEYSRSSR